MLARLRQVCILICLLPLVTPAQTPAPLSSPNDRELLAALFKAQREQPSQVQALLQINAASVTPRLWQQVTELAASAYYSNTPENSLTFYEIARQVAEHLRDRKLLAKTYYDLGRTLSALNRLPQAVEAYLNSKRTFEEAGSQRDVVYLLSDLGKLYFIQESYEKARDYSEQSIRLADELKKSNAPAGAWPDEYGVAGALATLAELSSRDGDHERAVEYLQRSLMLYQRIGRGNLYYNFYIADVHAILGRVYTSAGDYTQALSHLNKALEVTKTLTDPGRTASLLNSLGFLYMEQEDYAQATERFNQSLQLYLAQKNQRESARVLLNLGVIEQRQANYEKALELFRKSYQMAEAARNVDVLIAAGEGIGVVLGAKGDHAAALQTLNKSLDFAREVNDKTRQAELLWRLAETHHAMGSYTQAATLSEDALRLSRALRLPKLTYLATTTLGQSYDGQNKVNLAVQTLTEAVEQVEAMRDQVAGQKEEVRLFFENKVASYHALITLLIKQGKPLDALLLAERAKGRVLLDVLREGKIDLAKVMTPAEREEARRLNRNILELSERIRRGQTQNAPDDTHFSPLYAELDAARLSYQSFQDAFYASHPDLSLRRGRTPSLTPDSITNVLPDGGTAYLEYVFTKSQVYLFALTKKGSDERPELKAYPIAMKPEDLTRKVNQFHRMMADRNPAFASVARELYDLLVKPATPQLQGTTTLCLIPDGSLWDVPFQALISAGDRYLLEDYALYYAPSLSVLQEMNRRQSVGSGQANGSLIAFGNPVIGAREPTHPQATEGDEALCPLPEAETEVTTLAQIYGNAQSKVLVGREASEKTFKNLAPAYRTIHLATHGILDNNHPLYSHLLLTKTEGEDENDGFLEAREVMDMSLHADLAVLSACETARGRVGAGEGVIGMSWAFFIAGTRTTVVSQWKVNSASTSQLMMSFYQALKSSQSNGESKKADALRKAALSLMKDSRYRHPFYWAGFVMVGSND